MRLLAVPHSHFKRQILPEVGTSRGRGPQDSHSPIRELIIHLSVVVLEEVESFDPLVSALGVHELDNTFVVFPFFSNLNVNKVHSPKTIINH